MTDSAASPAEVGGLAIDPDVLGPPVARALGEARVEVTGWRAQQLRAGAGNPTSAGAYRLAGKARTANGAIRPWSVVLKVFQSPASVGRPDFGDEIDHWNYWLRELRGFETGLLADLPGGVVAPAFLGWDEAETRAWLWMEDVGDLVRETWTVTECCIAAAHLGRMEGTYMARGELPAMPWLARGMIRQWAGMVGTYGPSLAALAAAEGPFARLVPAVGRPALDSLASCLAEPAGLLDALDQLPHTFSHQDANVDNLLLRDGPDGRAHLLALDWQLMGLSPAGAVVGELLNSLGDVHGPPAWARDAEVLAAYRAGLREAGAQVPDAAVELAYVASTVLRQGIFMFVVLRQDIDAATGVSSSGGSGQAANADEVTARFVVGNERMLARLARLAQRARQMAQA